ncbi:hypothetical protein PR202_gb21894 [Eleusine coracana subsp. coracana]|uniref:Uncharacterized protein n=1 Tax=Eleusine coracana subsp. coracana TaxID=191504 RepID=A0AAV5FF65_ELECO|nr:hypothetical protein PR202_gb21894 [Eleusine coracana subsp. coracana]
MLTLSLLCVGTLFVAPVSFLSFVHTDDGGAAAAALATAARAGPRWRRRGDRPLLLRAQRSASAAWAPTRRAATCGTTSPAVVFSTGGYTGNVYHEFNDGVLPLFVTAHHLRRRVVFVILEYHDWWVTKYGDVVSRLSAFPPIDFANDRRVHCFPEVIAGLRIHGELTVDPARTPEGKSVADFRRLLDDAYRGRIQFLEIQERRAARKQQRHHHHRRGTRPVPHLVPPRHHQENEADVAAMAAAVGFDVRVVQPDRTTELCKIYRELKRQRRHGGRARRRHDALPLHARPGTVFIQVVPLGTDWAAGPTTASPRPGWGCATWATRSTRRRARCQGEYPAGDPVLTDPAGVAQRGWDVTKKVYLDRQNVRLDLNRFREELVRAHRYLVDTRRKATV